MNEKRGAPEGNQYARTHGFYSKVLDEFELMEYENATQVYGLDEEIALLRAKIMSLAKRDPENIKLITHAVNALAKVLMIKYNISKDDKETILQAVGNVLKNALPASLAGIELLKKLRS